MTPYRFREYRPRTDEGVVLGYWINSLGSAMRVNGHMKWLFDRHHHTVAEGLIARSHVIIACDQADDDAVYGWIVGEPSQDRRAPTIVHYAFVKEVYRKLGLGGALVKELLGRRDRDASRTVVLTHRTAPWIGEYALRNRWTIRRELAFYLAMESENGQAA